MEILVASAGTLGGFGAGWIAGTRQHLFGSPDDWHIHHSAVQLKRAGSGSLPGIVSINQTLGVLDFFHGWGKNLLDRFDLSWMDRQLAVIAHDLRFTGLGGQTVEVLQVEHHRDDFARFDRTHELGANHIERAGF